LPHGVAKPGARLDFPFDADVRQAHITEILEASKEFDRVAFEVQAVVAAAKPGPKAANAKPELALADPDVWRNAS
jgi:hypothetical protein